MDYCDKLVNHVRHDDFNIWHSRLCHINFGYMMRLANFSLIPKFDVVKGSKCHACVQAKQPCKPHKAVKEVRNLAPLDLIHSDLCEMNGVLTKGGKRYFMTLIDDCTRFCYVYLLNTKDEALHYFKVYKAEVENQLEKKSNGYGPVMEENTSHKILLHSVRNMELFMRGHLHIPLSPMGLQKGKTTL